MSNNLLARTGRHRQRYEDQLRLVAGLEKNFEKQNSNLENRVLVLMISTPNRHDLVFPKGGWEDDETIDEAACREALEEAGVKGLLGKNPLGVWEFRSKSRQNSCSKEGGCRGYMFAMEVTEELDSWPEQASYKRKWLCVEEAFKFCRYDWMREALEMFLIALKKERTQGIREMMQEFTAIPVSDAAGTADQHQTLSPPGCSDVRQQQQQLEESRTNCVVQGQISLYSAWQNAVTNNNNNNYDFQ